MDKKTDKDYQFILQQTSLLNKANAYATQKNWEALERKIHKVELHTKLFLWMRNAAAILTFPLLMASLYLWNNSSFSPLAEEWIEITSAKGLVSKIVLPDSSIVWLNSASTLRYPRIFTGNHREVSLNGEAYFRVKADKKNRFDVNMPQEVTISAYGTEFNVASYKNSTFIEAVLAKGSIEIQKNHASKVILKEGEKAMFNKANGTITVKPADMEKATSWREGKLVFRRTGLKELLEKLSRQYNVYFIVQGNSLANYEFSATFIDESLIEILDILCYTAPMSYQIEPIKDLGDYTYQRRKIIVKIH